MLGQLTKESPQIAGINRKTYLWKSNRFYHSILLHSIHLFCVFYVDMLWFCCNELHTSKNMTLLTVLKPFCKMWKYFFMRWLKSPPPFQLSDLASCHFHAKQGQLAIFRTKWWERGDGEGRGRSLFERDLVNINNAVHYRALRSKNEWGWVTKSVARQLATAALWVRIQTCLKNHKWAT